MTVAPPEPDPSNTNRERPVGMSGTDGDTEVGLVWEAPEDDPNARIRAREDDPPDGTPTGEDESGGHEGMSGTDDRTSETTHRDHTPDDTTPHKPSWNARLTDAAHRWGVDVRPPSFAREGLPPLNDSRAYANSGNQAAVTGPARSSARGYDAATRPIRWTLRLADHLLARPGRLMVALAALAVLARIEAIRTAVLVVVALIDVATHYTGLQWLLGLN